MALFIFLIFMVSYFLHLTARYSALGAIRFDLVLALLTLGAVLLSKRVDDNRFKLPLTRRLLSFLGYVLISLPLVTWPGSVLRFHLAEWLKVIMFFLLLVSVVRTERQLFWTFGVFLACQIFRVLEPLYLHITTGYWGDVAYSNNAGFVSLNRLAGAPADIVNANQLAWLCVSVLPFLFYLLGYGGKLWKTILLALVPAIIYALLLTGSRSGLLCLVFTVLAIVWVSQHRGKALFIACVVTVPLGAWAIGHMGGDMQTRYLSIVDSTVAGGDTAQGRISGLLKTLSTVSHNPLFGNGLGTSGEANHNIMGGSAQITHNLYLEVVQESGLIGFVLFVLVLVSIDKTLKAAQATLDSRGYDRSDWLFRLILGVRVWVYMDLFYSLSCFGLRSWEWYFFGGIATLCLVFANTREKAEATMPELRSV